MKTQPPEVVEGGRRAGVPGSIVGAFEVLHEASGFRLGVIATDGTNGPGGPPESDPEITEWEHVSVSRVGPMRTVPPTWDMMCFVKDLFWDEDEVVVQYHPAKKDYVNIHPGVLHLWRFRGDFPTPSKAAV